MPAVVVVVDVGPVQPGLVSPLLTPGPRLMSRRQSVLTSSLLAGGGGLPLDKVDNAAIKLVLRHLLVILENPAAEYEPLSVSRDPHRPTDSLLKLFDSFLLINFCELVILGVQGFNCYSPHIFDDSLTTVYVYYLQTVS